LLAKWDIERSENKVRKQAITFLVQVDAIRGENSLGGIFGILLFKLGDNFFSEVKKLGARFFGNFPADV
jgi:hypothetical protein